MERIAVLVASSPASPSATRAFQLVRDLTAAGHAVTLCLLEDGVYGARSGSPAPLEQCAGVLAVADDLALRGLAAEALHPSCRPGSYAEVVDLLMTGSDRSLGAF